MKPLTAEWVAKAERDFATMEREAYLSVFAVSVRYPGESADLTDASDARRRCRAFRVTARRSLGLDI